MCVVALLGERVEGEYSTLPTTKVDKKMMHQSISTAGGKEVGGKVEALDKKRWRTR